MAADAFVLDILLTWIGAAACVRYLYFLHTRADRRSLTSIRLLVAVIATVLLARGLAWWLENVWLYRLAIAASALLPLAITLFVERLLRRHHPLWLKLLALATSMVFLAGDVMGRIEQSQAHFGFMVALGVVLVANGYFLVRVRAAQVTVNEQRLASTLVVVALLSVPLIVSDYELLPLVPLRLDAIAALVFVYVMVSAAAHDLAAWILARRLVLWFAGAAVLAGVFALAASDPNHSDSSQLEQRFVVGIPVAYAWLLASAIFARCRAVSADADANEFERWLGAAPLDSLNSFVAAFSAYAPMQDYMPLGATDLSAYDLPILFGAIERQKPVTLAWARAHGGNRAAEQWLDLLEHHQMTLALPISLTRPLIILLNQPACGVGTVAYLRAALAQGIASRLADIET